MWRKEEVKASTAQPSADCWAPALPQLLSAAARGCWLLLSALAQTLATMPIGWQARVSPRPSPVAHLFSHSLPPTSFSGKPEGGGTGAARALPAPDGKKEGIMAGQPPRGWNHAACST
jgi:hypothetical protein